MVELQATQNKGLNNAIEQGHEIIVIPIITPIKFSSNAMVQV